MKLIFDSNVFDDLISGELDFKTIKEKNHEIYITHIQKDEINECSNKEKRAKLLNLMKEAKIISTESTIIGTSRIGFAKIGDGKLIEKTNDALIGETAIKKNLILITNDKKFKNKVIKLCGTAMTVDELKKSNYGKINKRKRTDCKTIRKKRLKRT